MLFKKIRFYRAIIFLSILCAFLPKQAFAYSINEFSLFAVNSLHVGYYVEVYQGHVGVRNRATGPIINSDNVELFIEQTSEFAGDVIAPKIYIKNKTTFYQDIIYRDSVVLPPKSKRDIYGEVIRQTSSSFWPIASLPAAPVSQTGSTNISVAAYGSKTINPGKFNQ